jgi:hypothetical protein
MHTPHAYVVVYFNEREMHSVGVDLAHDTTQHTINVISRYGIDTPDI